MILGVETPGLYDASPPRRRSESFRATEASAIAEAAAAASAAAAAASSASSTSRASNGSHSDGAEATEKQKFRYAATQAAENVARAEGLGARGAAASGKERDNLLQIGGASRCDDGPRVYHVMDVFASVLIACFTLGPSPCISVQML